MYVQWDECMTILRTQYAMVFVLSEMKIDHSVDRLIHPFAQRSRVFMGYVPPDNSVQPTAKSCRQANRRLNQLAALPELVNEIPKFTDVRFGRKCRRPEEIQRVERMVFARLYQDVSSQAAWPQFRTAPPARKPCPETAAEDITHFLAQLVIVL